MTTQLPEQPNPLEGFEAPPVELDEIGQGYVAALARIRAQKKELEQQESRAKARLIAYLNGADRGTVNGTVAVQVSYIASNRLDTARLRDELPDVVEQYTKTSTSTRLDIAEGALR